MELGNIQRQSVSNDTSWQQLVAYGCERFGQKYADRCFARIACASTEQTLLQSVVWRREKGNRTDITYFFGNYGQQQEGESGASSLKLRDKSARSVLLATFNNSDGRVVTLFQIRYYSGEELRTVYGMAHKILQYRRILQPLTQMAFGANVWKRIEYRKQQTHCRVFNGPKAYEEKMLLVFGMRSDKALTLFNQIVGVKVLNDLDSFIRDNMLEERDAEENIRN